MDRKARRLRLDQGQLQQILGGLSEGIMILDPDGVIVWANQTALGLHGCTTVDELGATVEGRQRKFILKSVEGRVLKPREYPTRRLMAGDTFNDLVVEVAQRRDASIRRIFRVRGLTLGKGQAVEFLVIVMHDVTALYDAQARSKSDLDAYRRTEEALRQSEERFSTIFRLAPLPMTVARLPNIDRIERNEAFKRTLLTSDDPRVAGSPLRQRRAEAVRQISDMLLAGKSVRNFAHTWVNLQGEPVDFLISSELIHFGGEPHMLSVFEDVTERNRSEAELAAAINDVLRDASWFGRTVLEKLAQIQQPRKPAAAGLDGLTQRELQVLGLICEGMSDAAIATRLGLSPNTVRNHVAALYGKIGVNRRSAAVVWGRQRGITGGGARHR